ncbi:MAG: type II secretion system protein [Sedimentisphaerales bacterium]|nr:type II secretion system protein [Sedimentisphaerales bacterium]
MKMVRTQHKGFTLIEATLAVVVLGIAAAGVLLPFSSGAAAQAEGLHRTKAAILAGDLLEQIVSKPFNTVAGSFNDILDYNGYTELQGQIKDSAGNVFTDPAYAKFSRSATCDYIYPPWQAATYSSVFIQVTVKVSYGGSELISLTRLVSQ